MDSELFTQLTDLGIELKDDDKQTLEKLNYKDVGSLVSGIANKERMISQSVRFPDDKSTEEDKVKFNTRISSYLGSPEKPEDITFDRPKDLPTGMIYDENMETEFRQLALSIPAPHRPSKVLISAIAKWYNDRQVNLYNQYNKNVSKDLDEFRKEVKGEDNLKAIIGNPEDKNAPLGKVQKALLQLSSKLGLDYKDDKGNPQSKLIDCLELHKDGKGSLGDKIPLIKVFAWIYDNVLEESKTYGGEPVTQTTKSEAYSEMDKKE